MEEHTLCASCRVAGRFALDTPDGPVVSSGQPLRLLLGLYRIDGVVESDGETQALVPIGGSFQRDHIALHAAMIVRI